MNADQLREANGQDAAVEYWRARALKAEAELRRKEAKYNKQTPQRSDG